MTPEQIEPREADEVDNVVPLPPRPVTPPRRASVVVVGGGVMGTSIVYHLAEAGVRDVVLLERNRLGSGSSAKPLGGVRATFSDPGNIALGQRSLEAFEQFGPKFGVDIALRQVGYLFLCRTDEQLDDVEASTRVQAALGGSARMVTLAAAAELNPLVDPGALTGASFSPRDGYARPSQVVRGYADAARRLWVRICEQTEVLDVHGGHGSDYEVHTPGGTLSTPTLVCAAGAWSSRLGAMVGVGLPIEPVRRQIGVTAVPLRPYPVVPFTLDLSSTLYFHNCGEALLLGISNRDQEPSFDRDFSYRWVPAFDRAAAEVAPGLVGLPLAGGWAGLYENTPDHNAMIGRSGTAEGFYYATGFSGHGFLQGPAVGEIVRDLYLGREPFLDPAPFSADRFAGLGPRLSETHII